MEGTEWQYYRLITTQWKTPEGKYTPLLNSNLTLETFEQEASSCVGCHHQVTRDPFDPINQEQYDIGNRLTQPIVILGLKDTLVYSDYMWSLLKVEPLGQLTWSQVSGKKDSDIQ